jgi:hypothetical protein
METGYRRLGWPQRRLGQGDSIHSPFSPLGVDIPNFKTQDLQK